MPQQHPPQYKKFEPRRSRPVRNVLVALAVAGGVAGAGAAVVASIGESGQSQPPSPSVSPTVRGTPRTVSAGKAFTIGRHQMLAGWRAQEEFGRFTVAGRVRNVSDKSGTAFLQFTFLKGKDVLGSVQCVSDELEPGQTGTLICVPDGLYSRSYSRITAEATS
jgi:hypothetical protein